jgi:hypothetical protein
VRTILAGLRAVRRAPVAAIPLVAEGAVGAVLIAAGTLPAAATAAPATAAFPLDVYFDVKQSIAFGKSWLWVGAAMALSLPLRSLVLAATFWLQDGRSGSFLLSWARALKLVAVAAVLLFPTAGLFFVGVATRYAPFVFLAGLLGVVTAGALARRAVRIDAGAGEPRGKGVPEFSNFLAYGYVVILVGVLMSAGDGQRLWAVVAVAAAGPLHALILLGWREHVRAETHPGGGTIALIATAIVAVALFLLVAYDRVVRNPPPVADVSSSASLVVLGGVDSTSRSGALARFDPRDIGMRQGNTTQLSYRDSPDYAAEDTKRDLDEIARTIGRQIGDASEPRFLLGHSQAGLILDRVLRADLPAPDRAVVFANPPPYPPGIEIPAPGKSGPGAPGGDFARAFSKVLDIVGLSPVDVDAQASPTNLDRVVVTQSPTRRLSVWAITDSVWLDGDWRRPGEVNVVALTDHTGITNNATAVGSAKRFFAGGTVSDDESSWRGAAVQVLRFAFEPWRP